MHVWQVLEHATQVPEEMYVPGGHTIRHWLFTKVKMPEQEVQFVGKLEQVAQETSHRAQLPVPSIKE